MEKSLMCKTFLMQVSLCIWIFFCKTSNKLKIYTLLEIFREPEVRQLLYENRNTIDGKDAEKLYYAACFLGGYQSCYGDTFSRTAVAIPRPWNYYLHGNTTILLH